jgi:hypothetical protein
VARLIGTIAHESHHLGMHSAAPSSLSPEENVAMSVVSLAIAEGAATKFVSGAPAGCAPAIAGVPFNTLTPELTQVWNERAAEMPQLIKHQAELLDRALAGELTAEAFSNELRDYWLSGKIGRAYVIGAEMFGAIHHVFGKEKALVAMRDPRQLFALYNAALDAKPQTLARCVRVPEEMVQQALSIGMPKTEP